MSTAKFASNQVVFVTKYALTIGIQQATVSEKQFCSAEDSEVNWPGGCNNRASFSIGRDMFATIEEAQANVAKQCERKLKSLAKQTEAIRHIAAHGATVLPVRK